MKGHQDEETSREGQFAREPRPLGGDGFFHDLHQDFLAGLECVLHASAFFQIRLYAGFRDGEKFLFVADYLLEVFLVSVEFRSKIKVVQEGVAFIAYIHKAGVQAWHEFSHFGQVYVAHHERGRPAFFLEFHQPFVFQQGDGDFFGLNIYYNFACHFLVFTD